MNYLFHRARGTFYLHWQLLNLTNTEHFEGYVYNCCSLGRGMSECSYFKL